MSVSGGGDSEARPEERKQPTGAISPAKGEQDAPRQTGPELLPPSRLRTSLLWNALGACLKHSQEAIQIGKSIGMYYGTTVPSTTTTTTIIIAILKLPMENVPIRI